MKYKKFDDFKIHCSRISTLMSKPKGYSNLSKPQKTRYKFLLEKEVLTKKEVSDLDFLKNKYNLYLNPPVLSVSAQNNLVDMYVREKYNLRNASLGSWFSLSQQKGFALEQDGIRLISKIDNIEYSKEKDLMSNDYLIGVCDVVHPYEDKIIEIKTSWNASNYMKNRRDGFKLPTEIWAQMQGYLNLYKKSEGDICYVLVNTPNHLIEQEFANLFKKYTYGEITREKYDEGCYKLEDFFDYNKIPEKKRVIRFNIKQSPLYMERVKSKVEMARLWLNNFERDFMLNRVIKIDSEEYLINNDSDVENESD